MLYIHIYDDDMALTASSTAHLRLLLIMLREFHVEYALSNALSIVDSNVFNSVYVDVSLAETEIIMFGGKWYDKLEWWQYCWQ